MEMEMDLLRFTKHLMETILGLPLDLATDGYEKDLLDDVHGSVTSGVHFTDQLAKVIKTIQGFGVVQE